MTSSERAGITRTLGIVCGVLTILIGLSCIFTPIATYGIVGWIIAVAMVADGASKILLWNDYRKMGVSDVWALVGGIISVVLGLVLLGSQAAQVAVDVLVAYVVAGWVLAAGCVRIVRSFSMRNVSKITGSKVLGTNWDLMLAVGILMVMLGIFCLANPLLVMITIGWQIGFALVMGGVGLITTSV
ncbi:MAG: DUF308 domain-containing protein [Atopobiaceae bacterium]|nr:DUF308 domain-containing protein [Atopobiaceae bacterium]